MRIRALLIACAGLFTGCLTSEPGRTPPARDTNFTVGSVSFPNDTAYSRGVSASGPNARIARFLEKCRTRDTVRIGFIGGSITEGAGASSKAFRYSSRLASFVQEGFPSLEKVVEINAGIGSTGTRFAASRAAEDLLSESPDLVVIEFAVNDFEAGSDDDIRAWMEGLVRQAMRDPDAAVILLFTAKGDGRNAQAPHAEVGERYGLPMVSYRDAIWPWIESGAIPWEAVFRDDPHPSDGGHRIAAHLLYAYLRSTPPASPAPPLPAPGFGGDLFESAGTLRAGDTAVRIASMGWTAGADSEGRLSYGSGMDSSTLTLTTRRRELTLGVRVQPHDTSSVRIRMEGRPDIVVNNHHAFAHTRFVKVFSEATAEPRTVRVVHSPGKAFGVDYVLYAGPAE